MRYLMKQKLFCWGDDFTIKNEAGEDVFFVDGKAFSFGDKLSFQDMQKNELAFIRQKLLAWGPTYGFTRNGELAAVVKKHLFTLFRCKFTVDVPGPADLELHLGPDPRQGAGEEPRPAFRLGARLVDVVPVARQLGELVGVEARRDHVVAIPGWIRLAEPPRMAAPGEHRLEARRRVDPGAPSGDPAGGSGLHMG